MIMRNELINYLNENNINIDNVVYVDAIFSKWYSEYIYKVDQDNDVYYLKYTELYRNWVDHDDYEYSIKKCSLDEYNKDKFKRDMFIKLNNNEIIINLNKSIKTLEEEMDKLNKEYFEKQNEIRNKRIELKQKIVDEKNRISEELYNNSLVSKVNDI